MIITRLKGGLGNQMFQYAVGKCLAEKHNDQLLLEPDSIAGSTCGLEIFNVQAEFLSVDEIIKGSALIFRIHQLKGGYHEGIFKCPRNEIIVLDGFWQNELYFKNIESIIRDEFTFKTDNFQASDLLMSEQISSTQAVCIHIRRGDYLLPKNSSHLTIDANYYDRAVEYIKSKVETPYFYIFSDDIEWCIDNFSMNAPHSFIRRSEPASDSGSKDFRLMTMCQHFIIANSTYSWWAAWLGSRVDKIVVAPSIWNLKGPLTTDRVVPNSWKII